MELTEVFYKTIEALGNETPLIVTYGGSSSSKTVSAMQALFLLAQNSDNLQIFFFAKTVPKLKTTLIEDFKRYVSGADYFIENFHRQDSYLLIPKTNSKINFVSADDPDKFRGVRADYHFFDEINTFRYGLAIFKELFARQRISTIVAFNPSEKFWITDYMNDSDCEVIHSTYLDNQFVPQQTIENLKKLAQKDENFKRVYIDGEWGVLEGQVYKYKENWFICDKLTEDYDFRVFGLDFGYTNDPTTIIELRINEKEKTIYEKEHLYKTGLLNSDIAEVLKNVMDENSYCIADSAEPKSIADIRKYDINILGAKKGADSIISGINKVKDYDVYVTSESKNLINEKQSYKYVEDKLTGEFINKTEDKNNHLMDAERYALTKFN